MKAHSDSPDVLRLPDIKLNVPDAVIRQNIASSIRRDLPWLGRQHKTESGRAMVIGGAPSIKKKLAEIKSLSEKAKIISVNGSYDFLLENAIIPDYFVMIDAREENDFVSKIHDQCVYLLSAQCNAKMFDRLSFANVILFHSHYKDNISPMKKILQVGRENNPNFFITPSCRTVGLVAMNMAHVLGFTEIDIYGMDSSFDDYQHAYKQKQNENDETVVYRVGDGDREFTTTYALVKQLEQCIELCGYLSRKNIKINMRSDGLMQEVYKASNLPS